MKKRTVMHREDLNVTARFLKSDFTGRIIEEGVTEYLPAGTLVKMKTTSEEIREKGGNVVPILVTDKAVGVLVHDVEFYTYDKEKTGTVAIEGATYLDKLVEVGKEHPTLLTVTKDRLPDGVTYIFKNRK